MRSGESTCSKGWWLALALVSVTVGSLAAPPLAAAGEDPDFRHLQGLGEVRYHRLESKLLERGFHLYVRLPERYGEREEHRFPTVYLLDGGVTFPLLAAYYRYLSLAEEVPDLILAGIAYGTDDWRQGNLRSTDFTAPTPEREFWGGAGRFQEMLQAELIPLVEREYRSDPERRTIFGQSLGGQFVLFTARTDPPLFWGHIASNPALHRNLEFFLQQPEAAGDGQERPRPKLFVASGELDDARFREPALRWIEHWQGAEGRGADRWELETVTLPGHGHFSAAPAAFRAGVRWLFSEPAEEEPPEAGGRAEDAAPERGPKLEP